MPGKYAELKKRAVKRTRERLKQKMYKRDHLIVQVVRSIDEMDKAANLLTERLRDWYAVYFPELERRTKGLEEYVNAVADIGYKHKLPGSEDSVGAELKPEDVDQVMSFARSIKLLLQERDKTAEYLESLVSQEAPNMTALLGPTLTARLISAAGSLKRLSEMPSSTIQVLGAEKALFAHLRKKGVPSPKHGLIFAYPEVRGSKKKLRGKIARKLAGKIAIAAKVDYFKGEFVGDKLKKEFEEEARKIR